MLKFQKLFPLRCSIIGMIHVDALPGTPLYRGSVESIIKKACIEAEIYIKNNIDGIILENMHDVPYIQSKHFTPEVTATLTRVATEIKRILPERTPCGIQVLSCGNKEALAIAKACGLNFIRAEGYVFAHIADEGITDANAGIITRYRKLIEADDILIWADIKKKHSSHTITADVSLVETAKAAQYFLADALVLTGSTTGDPTDVGDITDVKEQSSLPVIVGSGVTKHNLHEYLCADALIVGSYFKNGGVWSNDVDEGRVGKFMERMEQLQVNRIRII